MERELDPLEEYKKHVESEMRRREPDPEPHYMKETHGREKY